MALFEWLFKDPTALRRQNCSAALAERAYGKIKDRFEHSGPDSAPLAITVRFVRPNERDNNEQ